MKKLLAALLAALLCTICALAEAPEATPETETEYVLVNCFSENLPDAAFEYPAALLALVPGKGPMTFVSEDSSDTPALTLIITDPEIAPEDADSFIAEATGGYMPDEAVISEIEDITGDDGPGILTVEELAEEVERLCPLKSST